MKLSQKQLIIEYVKEHGSIIPAKMCGNFYRGQICGSDLPKRCRELRASGVLISVTEGKFEKFSLPTEPLRKIVIPAMTAHKFMEMFPSKEEVKSNTLF